MEYRLTELSQLSDDAIERLAVLHQSVMHTLLSDLGLPMVLRYYQIAQTDPGVIGLCASSKDGHMLGWTMGSPHPDKINTQLRSPLTWFIPQILRVMVTRPAVFWQLIASVLSTNQAELKSEAVELTYIGVASDQRGRGLGKILLNAFIEASHSHGYHSVVLSVEKENVPAIQLYEKAGFKIINTFSEGRYQRHRMELTLA
jgi:ribosomal protein S18 acetylase RimI-like enzyme